MKRLIQRAVLCLSGVAVLTGCGYTTQSSLPAEYQTIAVSPFYDQTRNSLDAREATHCWHADKRHFRLIVSAETGPVPTCPSSNGNSTCSS